MKAQTWKTEKHTCNKCCNAQVIAGKKYCDLCSGKKTNTNKIAKSFGFKFN